MADYVTKEPYFDFERGDFAIINGRVKSVTGLERVKNKVSKLLRTQKGKYKIYDDKDYGINLKNMLVGKNFTQDYMLSEIQREICEALRDDEDILSVDGFSGEADGTYLTVTFTVNTVFGNCKIKEVV